MPIEWIGSEWISEDDRNVVEARLREIARDRDVQRLGIELRRERDGSYDVIVRGRLRGSRDQWIARRSRVGLWSTLHEALVAFETVVDRGVASRTSLAA